LSFLTLRIKLILIFIFSQLLFASNAPYDYSYTPKVVYKNQIFPITILAKHYNGKEKIKFDFDMLSINQPINDNPVITLNKNEAFFTFYFKAKSLQDFIDIPSITISTIEYTYMLKPVRLTQKALDISGTDIFCGVLASNLRVNNVKIDDYDSKHHLITLSISAVEANLEDMHIPNAIEDGIENIKRDGANVTAKYYFVVPSSMKSIPFSYYNLIKQHFIDKRLDLNIDKQKIDNSDLAPKDLTFDKLKKYFLIGLTLLFVLLYIGTKDKLYIYIFVISFALLVYIYFPHRKVCIQEGANLYILPTNNSNISLQIDRKIKRSVIKKYNHYNKIDYKNGITGWIKDEDLCKN